jgi:hypothetical protein
MRICTTDRARTQPAQVVRAATQGRPETCRTCAAEALSPDACTLLGSCHGVLKRFDIVGKPDETLEVLQDACPLLLRTGVPVFHMDLDVRLPIAYLSEGEKTAPYDLAKA